MNKNQIGRSMVEMLGVLAIVGILSVGGISGYSLMMGKFKTSKIVNQFFTIHQNLRDLSGQEDELDTGNDEDTLMAAIDMGVFPNDMVIEEGGDKVVRHAGGGRVELSVKGDEAAVTFYDLPKDAAIALATADFVAGWINIDNDE